MKKVKLKTGEFSKMMQVTIKTLRHYEQMGILIPDEIDKWTGYRYYKLDQMQRLGEIRRLKEIGFSLEEIKELSRENSGRPDIEQLETKIRTCEEELKVLLRRKEMLHQMVDSQRKIDSMEKFSIQSLPEIIVASHREVIANYEAIGPYDKFYQSYTELFQYIEKQGYRITGQPRCCYVDGIWNQPNPEKWLSIIQVPVVSG